MTNARTLNMAKSTFMHVLLALVMAISVNGFTPSRSSSMQMSLSSNENIAATRRNVFAGGLGLALSLHGSSALAAAMPCKPGSNNCVAGQFTGAKDASDAALALKSVLESYPQSGQAGVDGGGWKIIDSSASTIKLEYYSAGTGNFAKFFNGGKPFTDDLTFAINSDGSVDFKSASRVGDSDFGVNAKRMTYIANGLKEKGWTAAGI